MSLQLIVAIICYVVSAFVGGVCIYITWFAKRDEN